MYLQYTFGQWALRAAKVCRVSCLHVCVVCISIEPPSPSKKTPTSFLFQVDWRRSDLINHWKSNQQQQQKKRCCSCPPWPRQPHSSSKPPCPLTLHISSPPPRHMASLGLRRTRGTDICLFSLFFGLGCYEPSHKPSCTSLHNQWHSYTQAGLMMLFRA